MAVASQQSTKIRWAELKEDDGDDLDFVLPSVQVLGPDENGIVEYKFDGNNKIKRTTTIRVRKLADARLNKSAIERRSWPKFGDAIREDVGSL